MTVTLVRRPERSSHRHRRPRVVAHRGASGYRPEHTLSAYRTAVRLGADAIEIDLVSTADGHLVARHDRDLSTTTDIVRLPEFAARRREDPLTGRPGWFVEDFTLAEVKVLGATERFPRLRPTNTAYDGREQVPTLGEILTVLREETMRAGRPVDLLVELKDPGHFDALGLCLDAPLMAELARHGLNHAGSGVSLMSFQAPVLRRLALTTELPLVRLLGLVEQVAPRRLAEIAGYASAIGPHKTLVLPRDRDGRLAGVSDLVDDAHAAGLEVLPWTLRAENRFLPLNLRRGDLDGTAGDLAAEARLLVEAGVDALITDHPDLVAEALHAVV